MPSRPDIRELASHVREAFADADRETLLDVLTFVVKEYVVEGPPPMLVHQAEKLADLQGATFAQVITALQTRFDHPELAMFVVDGEQVGVRIGGVVHPVIGQRTAPTAAELPRPAAGVRVVETTLAQRPAPPAQQAPQQAPPARGLSVRGAAVPGTGGGVASGPPPQPPPAQQPAQPQAAQPAAPQAQPDKPEGAGDDASARFSLLELD